jgi:hypothetical protein
MSGLRWHGSLALGFFSRRRQRLATKKMREYKVKAALIFHTHVFPAVVSATGLGSKIAPPAAERYPPMAFLLTRIDFLAGRRLAL